MIQGVYNFPKTVSGDTLNEIEFTLTDGVGPIDITGYVIKCNFMPAPDMTPLLLLSTEDSSIEITDAENGVFKINKFIVSLLPAVYIYDMEFELPNGDVYTYIKGELEVLTEITKND
jgi:hypothetical protein